MMMNDEKINENKAGALYKNLVYQSAYYSQTLRNHSALPVMIRGILQCVREIGISWNEILTERHLYSATEPEHSYPPYAVELVPGVLHAGKGGCARYHLRKYTSDAPANEIISRQAVERRLYGTKSGKLVSVGEMSQSYKQCHTTCPTTLCSRSTRGERLAAGTRASRPHVSTSGSEWTWLAPDLWATTIRKRLQESARDYKFNVKYDQGKYLNTQHQTQTMHISVIQLTRFLRRTQFAMIQLFYNH